MVLSTPDVKKMKGAAHKNGDIDATCKRALLHLALCPFHGQYRRVQSSHCLIRILHMLILTDHPPWHSTCFRSCRKVMFQSCLFVHRGGHVTITHDALDLTMWPTSPSPAPRAGDKGPLLMKSGDHDGTPAQTYSFYFLPEDVPGGCPY